MILHTYFQQLNSKMNSSLCKTPNISSTFPTCLLNCIFDYLSSEMLTSLKYCCKDFNNLLISFSHYFIRNSMHPGYLLIREESKMIGDVLVSEKKWKEHNFLCNICASGEYCDLKCFSCNLVFHSRCLLNRPERNDFNSNHNYFLCDDCLKDNACPISGYCMTLLLEFNDLVVCGGRYSSNLELNLDIYSYNMFSKSWKRYLCNFETDSLRMNIENTCLRSTYIIFNNYSNIAEYWVFHTSGGGDAFINIAYILDINRKKWKMKLLSQLKNHCPLQKEQYAITFLPHCNLFVLHGGCRISKTNASHALDEIHFLERSTGIWMKVRLRENDTLNSSNSSSIDQKTKRYSSEPVSPRSAHSMTLIGNELWLFGGLGIDTSSSEKRKPLNDIHVLQLHIIKRPRKKGHWILEAISWRTPLRITGRPPGRRSGHSATTIGSKLLICGGTNGARYLPCTSVYVLDTATLRWSNSLTTGIPLRPRLRPALVTGENGDCIIIYGGGVLSHMNFDGVSEYMSDGCILSLGSSSTS